MNRIKCNWKITLMSLLLALFCDAKCLNVILTSGNAEGGILAYIYIYTILSLVILGFLCKKSRIRINTSLTLMLFTIITCILSTISFVGMPSTSVLMILVQTFAAFLLPSLIIIDVRTFIYGLMIIPIPAIAKVNEIFVMNSIWYDAISMGLSYAFLTPVIASIVYIFVYFKHDKLLTRVLILPIVFVNFIYATYLILYGSRGPLLAIFLLIIYLLVVKYDSIRNRIVINKRRVYFLLVLGVFLLVVFIPIINVLNDLLQSYDLSFRFVEKILLMYEDGDISNGRTSIYEYTINSIFQRPIFGHGIGCFYKYYPDKDIQYPHNFILQLLYDGGIVLFLIIVIPVIFGIKKWYKNSTIDEYVLMSILLFSSVPRSMFSGDLWESGLLWLFFGVIVNYSIVVKRNI